MKKHKVACMLLAFVGLAMSCASVFGCDSYGQAFLAPQAVYVPQVQAFSAPIHAQAFVLRQHVPVQAVQKVRVQAVRQPRVEVQRIVIRRR